METQPQCFLLPHLRSHSPPFLQYPVLSWSDPLIVCGGDNTGQEGQELSIIVVHLGSAASDVSSAFGGL